MKLARVVPPVVVIAALGWGCTPDAAGPKAPSRLSAALVEPADFDYIANPPNVQVTSGTVLPDGLPFCGLGFVCYAPNFVRKAYNFPSTLDGRGQTILIVDAFGSPTVEQDLATFDRIFHLPPPPSFTILCPEGCPTFAPNNSHHGEVGWSIETSLDVQYAHAMAPGANIVLVVAATSSGNAINVAEAAAIAKYPGSIMSQSFGIPEILVHGNNAQIMQAHANYEAAKAAGITVLASAGDFGATNGFPTSNAGFPASDPLVTAVGGTQGNPYPFTLSMCAGGPCNTGLATVTGTCDTLSTFSCKPAGYGGEQVWNEPQFGAATGGAPSLLFPVPTYQNGLGLTARTIPDVSYNAAVNGGVLVVWSAIPPARIFLVGGTSAGSPQWAAIVALANQAHGAPLGFLNTALYKKCSASDFHDITVGNNSLFGTQFGFPAKAGWDDATGLGTPDVGKLVADLAHGC
jgi:subtilase family serine protease